MKPLWPAWWKVAIVIVFPVAFVAGAALLKPAHAPAGVCLSYDGNGVAHPMDCAPPARMGGGDIWPTNDMVHLTDTVLVNAACKTISPEAIQQIKEALK